MAEPKTLAEAFESFGTYPADHPQTLRELLEAEPDSLSHPLAWFLRREAVGVRRSTEMHYINGPRDALELLRNKYVLHPWTGKWTSYGLSESRQVIAVPHPQGGTTPLRKHTAVIPHAGDLPHLPRQAGKSARGPAWLVLFGGTPDVLSKPGVAKGLATLQQRVPVADILFYHSDKAGSVAPTLWSVRAGIGMRETGATEGATVDFPDAEALTTVRRTL